MISLFLGLNKQLEALAVGSRRLVHDVRVVHAMVS